MSLEVSLFQDVRHRSSASPGTELPGLKQEQGQELTLLQGGTLWWGMPFFLEQQCPGRAKAQGEENEQTRRIVRSLSRTRKMLENWRKGVAC